MAQQSLTVAKAEVRRLWVRVAIFSLFTNVFVLAGPIYMLQVYDRVLASRSTETLVALSLMVLAVYVGYGMMESVRHRLAVRAAHRLDLRLEKIVFETCNRLALLGDQGREPRALRDLDVVRQFLTGSAITSILDLPYSPIFIILIALVHPYLGLLALAGAVLLGVLAFLNEARTRKAFSESMKSNETAMNTARSLNRNIDAVQAMGMAPGMQATWAQERRRGRAASTAAVDDLNGYSSATRAIRLGLQSALLGLGAWLAVQEIITPGMMIAGTILAGRALQPIEGTIAQWRGIIQAREAWSRLNKALEHAPARAERTELPRVVGHLQLEHVHAAPPGVRKPVLRDITVAVKPGEALGVVGPSASGKSTLGRVMLGVWPSLAGAVRLDGATLDQFDAATLGPQLGYLPQDCQLLDGTVAQNISRFYADPRAEDIVAAAQLAGAHEMILAMSEGYDTRVGEDGQFLSSGQRQRIGLARAVYGSPSFVVLDEPNANLDASGDLALRNTVLRLKAKGASVVVIAHRPSAIEACDTILVLDAGTVRMLGPRAEVMAKIAPPTNPPAARPRPAAAPAPIDAAATGTRGTA